jgi:hypothetical protein
VARGIRPKRVRGGGQRGAALGGAAEGGAAAVAREDPEEVLGKPPGKSTKNMVMFGGNVKKCGIFEGNGDVWEIEVWVIFLGSEIMGKFSMQFMS